MTLDVHHPSPADVDPLGEGLSARHCRQRASERDKNRDFMTMCFMVVRLLPSIASWLRAALCITANSDRRVGMSALCQKRTSPPTGSTVSADPHFHARLVAVTSCNFDT